MSRPALEVADIFRDHGAAWRKANAGHVSLGQMKVMSAIEHCRTAALGGHVARCENDKYDRFSVALFLCAQSCSEHRFGDGIGHWICRQSNDATVAWSFHPTALPAGKVSLICYERKSCQCGRADVHFSGSHLPWAGTSLSDQSPHTERLSHACGPEHGLDNRSNDGNSLWHRPDIGRELAA